MRTLRLCGLTLAVAAAHAGGWRLAVSGLPDFAPARAGIRALALVARPAPAQAAAPAEATPHQRVAPAFAEGLAPPVGDPAAGDHRAQAPPRMAAPRTGAHGAAARGPLAAPAWPVYATRVPPSTTLRYAVRQGGAQGAQWAGDAELDWHAAGAQFSLRVSTAITGRAPREWLASGGFDRAGVAPDRLLERENGRDRRAVNFDRGARRVRFSGSAQSFEFAPGAQDRWSWIAQLAAIAEAAAARRPAATRRGTTWDLQVAGLRGELDHWRFRVLDDAAPPPAEGNDVSSSAPWASDLLHVLRESERPYDLRIEAWLSPRAHHLPVALRMSTPPGPWSLALSARDEPGSGQAPVGVHP